MPKSNQNVPYEQFQKLFTFVLLIYTYFYSTHYYKVQNSTHLTRIERGRKIIYENTETVFIYFPYSFFFSCSHFTKLLISRLMPMNNGMLSGYATAAVMHFYNLLK